MSWIRFLPYSINTLFPKSMHQINPIAVGKMLNSGYIGRKADKTMAVPKKMLPLCILEILKKHTDADHTLDQKDILELLGECTEMHGHNCSCGCQGHGHAHDHKFTSPGLGIKMTESYAMIPDSCICGLIFMHPEACYPEIRRISQEQYDDYAARRGMEEETARRFLGHLLK